MIRRLLSNSANNQKCTDSKEPYEIEVTSKAECAVNEGSLTIILVV